MFISLFGKASSALALFGCVILALSACKPSHPQASQDGEASLRDAGYSSAPIITGVVQTDPDTLTLIGKGVPNGIVSFVYGGHRAGVTADSEGQFKADLPAGPLGGVYDVSTEDSGRDVQAEGRLFVPPGQPLRTVLMRPGSASLPLFDHDDVVAVMDYDKAGVLAVSGKVMPHEAVTIRLAGEILARERSDDRGIYSALMQINPAFASRPLVVQVAGSGGATAERTVTLAAIGPQTIGDKITPIEKGWRVDWALPGGGEQTTFIF